MPALMKYIKTFFLILFLAVVLVFSIQNMQTTTFAFFGWSMTLPLSLASVVIYILGALSGGLVWSLIKKMTADDPQHAKGTHG